MPRKIITPDSLGIEKYKALIYSEVEFWSTDYLYIYIYIFVCVCVCVKSNVV
jgi:hypothetical protein